MSQTVIIPDKSNCIIRVGAGEKFPWPSQFPGFAKEKTGTRDIIFRPTANNIKYINQHWPDAEWIDGTSEHLDRFIEEQKEAAISSNNKQVILEDDGSYEYKTAPFDHQRQLFLLSRDREVFAYFMEQGCVDSETEYLSPEGWVKISEYSGGKVAQWHPEDSTAEFIEPIEYVKKPCNDMYHFKNKHGVNQMLSPEHKVPYYYRGKLKLTSAEEFAQMQINKIPGYNRRCLPAKFTMNGQDGINISDDNLRLQIALMADGSFPSHSPHTKFCTINIKKKRKIDRLNKLLAKCGKTRIYEKRSHHKNNHDFYKLKIKEDGFHTFTFYAPIRLKAFDNCFWKASTEQIKIICNEICHWDGTIKENGSMAFFSKNKSDCDFIQYCFSSIGKISRIFKGNGIWDLHIRTRGEHFYCRGNNISKVKSTDGHKYCFEVPSGFLIFRREGCVFPSGNTGKSKPIIDTAAYLYSQGKIQALIIIADNGVHSNWIEEEIPIHMPDWCPHKMWTYSSNMTKGREKDFEEVAANDNVLRIFAFNVEGFTSEKAKKKLENIIDIRNLKAMVVIDESESIKNATTKRSKYLTRACRDVEYKRILTGTPVTQGIEDLYSQCLWLGDQVLGYDSFWTFRGQFCTMGGYEMKKIVGYKNIDELVSLLDGYSFRVLKKECLDLPEKIYKRWPVELTPRQRTMYNDIKNKYWTELEGHGTIEADLAIVRLLRLQQITCGWFPNDDMVAIPGDNPKLEATRQYVSSVNTPALIWCRFKKDIKNITEELRRDHGKDVIASYFGETSTEDRTQHVKNFQAGHYKAMVCSSAASRGLTLTASSNSFYHSNGNKYGDRIQSEDRNHRIGTKNNVVYTDCVAKNTIDNQFIRAFKRKKNVSDMVTQDPESFFLEEAA